MALTQRLAIRPSQALVMTPQLMQAIKLLQLSNLDLSSYVDGELERNPLLERIDDDDGDRRSPEHEAPPPTDPAAAADWAEGGSEERDAKPPERAAAEPRGCPSSR